MKKKIKPSLIILIVFTLFIGTYKVKALNTFDSFLNIKEIINAEQVIIEKEREENFSDANYKALDNILEDNLKEILKVEEEKRKEEERKRNESLKSQVVSYAKRFVGGPYVMGGNSLTNGTDCSGFVKLVYAHFGYKLPRTTTGQAQSGRGVSVSEIKPGDIISYGYNGHVQHSALYIGNGKIIHASTPQGGIRYDSMYIMPIITVRRI